ncbi:phage portal protein [Hyalangium sp.]|uniref:phage portal protein n=1 Tax=Hyalangium sp. TaxID=2028555 RepID=UPI002D56300E|nr:phage portal protein [Hyalangium sp.]HYH96018.1 phage portal protein [Hyalangium sp.]
MSTFPVRRGSRQVLTAYREHAWLQAVVDTVAESVATPRWRVFKVADKNSSAGRALKRYLLSESRVTERRKVLEQAEKDGGLYEVRGHPIQQLLENPHPKFPGRELRKLMAIHCDLAGETFQWLSRDAAGAVVGFQVLPPTAVSMTPTLGRPYFAVTYNLFSGHVPEQDMIWCRHLDPENPEGRGVGRGRAAGDELDSSEAIQRGVKATFERGGLPLATIGVEGGVGDDDDGEDLEKRYEAKHTGAHNAGKVFFLGGKVSVATLQQDMRALQMVETDKAIRDFVRQIYNVSPELMGDLSSSNRSTSEEAKYTLAEYATLPRLEFFRSWWQLLLMPQEDGDAILEYDDPRPQSWERRLKAMTAAYNEAFTLNEARRLAELAPDPELEGQRFKPLPGAKPVQDGTPTEPQNPPPPRGPAEE